MRDDPPAGSPLSWKDWLLLPARLLAWPAVIAPSLWRARRFHRVARQASGWRHQIVPDGVEVWTEDEPPKLIPWAEFRKARWLVHTSPSMASGEEQFYAVELSEEGVALCGYAEDLLPLLKVLCERAPQPKLEDGGRTLGAAGWLLTMLWLGTVVLLAVLLAYGWRRASG